MQAPLRPCETCPSHFPTPETARNRVDRGYWDTLLEDLVRNVPAARVYLSYSSEGHVELDDLERSLAPLGDLAVHQLGPVGRYRPNAAASAAATDVTEYVVELQKSRSTLEPLVQA